jgi:hypothetical protein
MVSLLKKTNGQRLTQKRGEVVVKIDESDCDFLNTFPHEKFWGLFSQKKKTQEKCTRKNGWIPILNPHLCGELRSLH